MKLCTMYDLLEIANKNNYVLGSFNTSNLEISLSIIDGANECGYPVSIQISPPSIELSGFDYIRSIAEVCAKNADVPVCLHLDHGKTFDDVKNAVENGFTSIMIDGSRFSYEENIELTKKVVDYCHPLGISVEAELGVIQGKEDSEAVNKKNTTNPDLVKFFCEKSGCDMLAVSIGNEHGLEHIPKIDFELLKEINKVSKTPLVVHGGSGIPDSTLSRFKDYNIKKVNFSSELKRAFISTIGQFYVKNNNEYNIVSVTRAAKENIKKVVVSKLDALNK